MTTPTPHRASVALALLCLAAACGSQDSAAPPLEEPSSAEAPSPEDTAPPAAPDDERLGQALVALGSGDFATCRDLATAVLSDHPDHPRAHFLLGLGLHKAKRYAEARPPLVAADAPGGDNPGREAAPYFLGWCHYYLGELGEARAAFTRHLETVDEGDSHFGLGVVALELGELDVARTKLDRALVIFEGRVADGDLTAALDLAKTHTRLADVDIAEERDEDARAHVEAALSIDPSKAALWFKLYNLATAAGDEVMARRALGEYEARKDSGGAGMAMDR